MKNTLNNFSTVDDTKLAKITGGKRLTFWQSLEAATHGGYYFDSRGRLVKAY
ncbi:ComC/BlpC family leader-containing pheromone/bacteriocin [Fructilactobacillus frigidiflavus]|uniref:ComC/BlpC family leader-containing pheromone/bacteriocin n=1 Tax=Fructilactobacillus frigidiflavus TaxID=3242688 RepID=UPI00375741F5